jgi:hypothetical protein
VQVHFGSCHHVFGHRCLRRLIHGREIWCNKCPLCRAHWFSAVRDVASNVLAENNLTI